MKSLTHKRKYSAMEFARQNADIKCVLYAKVGSLRKNDGSFNTEPRIITEGSCGYLECMVILHRYNRKYCNIVTKSFYENVLTAS